MTARPALGRTGAGFDQPLAPHQHWHVDVSHINMVETFYYLCSLLDGCFGAIVHHELRQSITDADVEIVLQRALENTPEPSPGSSPATVPSSSPRTSKSSSAWPDCPMSKPPLTIPSPTEKSNAGTSRSKPTASAPAPPQHRGARRHIAIFAARDKILKKVVDILREWCIRSSSA
jgi:hypothetical protein